ncbi:MAG: site-specific DNA-methyltransferase [Bacillota bacterium]
MSGGNRHGEPVIKETTSILNERIEQLKQIFPEVFTEGRVDFEKLRASLGSFEDERPERYTFNWAGKRDAIRLLQTPCRATLIPAKDESVNFDSTEHLFIEGDNLEVLKLLYKSYFGRVKMIYIDPPYNTGNDFIYPDNYTDPLDTYLKVTGQKDADGNMLTSNPETGGRYHSAWLSMMYPRLFLARQLLREDGVIFVSIDDHEVYNLRLIMNEVFGEENFICALIWKRRQNVDSRAKTGVSVDHEYLVVYRKVGKSRLRGQEKDLTKYNNPDDDPRGPWLSGDLTGLATKEQRPNLHYDLINPETGDLYPCPENGWRYCQATMARLIKDGRIIWPPMLSGRPRMKRYQNELSEEFTGLSSVLTTVYNTQGTRELKEIFDGKEVMDFPKPVEYIKLILQQATTPDGNDIVLDFFAGSCTSAQAVMELNRQDDGNRRFIMVQLPEPIESAKTLDNGTILKTIADIGKERIRRIIDKMNNADKGQLSLDTRETPEDLGFKVFKLAGSNFKPWDEAVKADRISLDPEVYAAQMEIFTDPLVEGWSAENVVYEVAVKEGYGLNLCIERVETIKDLAVYRVNDPDKNQRFFICLDDKIQFEELGKLALTTDELFICRDSAIDDESAANLALQCRLKTI